MCESKAFSHSCQDGNFKIFCSCSMGDLSSLSRDGTHVSCSRSAESWQMAAREVPVSTLLSYLVDGLESYTQMRNTFPLKPQEFH